VKGSTEILDNFEGLKLERPQKVGDVVLIDRFILSLNEANELVVQRFRKKSIDWLLHVLLGISFAVTLVYLIIQELGKEYPSWMLIVVLGAVSLASIGYSIYIPYRSFSKKATWVFRESGVLITNDFGKERRIATSSIHQVYVRKTLVHVNGLEQHYTFNVWLQLNEITGDSGHLFSVGGSDEYLNQVDYYYNEAEIERAENDALQIAGIIRSFLRLD